MQQLELKEIVFQIIMSYQRNESHCFQVLQDPKIKQLIKSATSQFDREPILKTLNGSFVVVGDLHGDLGCLFRVFQRFGYPPDTSYVFLGDYVDRGKNSLEVIILLLSIKLLFPDNIHLLRGNHESKQTTKKYGFRSDCEAFIDNRSYRLFLKCFSYMPLAAIINNSIFCVHGGISQGITEVAEIEQLQRPINRFNNEIFVDLLWSDPSEEIDFFDEGERGIGHLFGAEALDQFLQDNNFKMLIRGHECPQQGYCYSFKNRNCLTVFSATNYCSQSNDSSVAVINGENVDVVLFQYKCQNDSKHIILTPDWIKGEFEMKDPIDQSIVHELLSPTLGTIPTIII
ncbi:Ser/Thr protein phosphatase [Histomonas meleagridis]|uniref:Ser/Thr protein phosphatase n=1 Tax=Histomonas meleagridis TaxID=135588 RepID=UPI00355ACC69|nr:Ser/Thr protein phosphatase [Histomonas meleagridis]KAH0806087.1 Ser/Thr protein phosphatase [Histomonas meleagridis]